MLRIVVVEPNSEVRDLLVRQLAHLGHKPLTGRRPGEEPTLRFDALLIEPSDPVALIYAQQLRILEPDLPIVCVSIRPRWDEPNGLGPVAYLEKPVALAELERVFSTLTPRAPGRPPRQAFSDRSA